MSKEHELSLQCPPELKCDKCSAKWDRLRLGRFARSLGNGRHEWNVRHVEKGRHEFTVETTAAPEPQGAERAR